MITLFRMFRCWQLRAKWRLALWKFIDQQAIELINHESNKDESETQGS
ncbi:MAG: hypothetical protein K2J95_01880 [Lachnospiraceae bacterium]|nr:hypothetical protein [Lachnospiraceae bacterium]